MYHEHAECGELSQFLHTIGEQLDDYLGFEHPDAMTRADIWMPELEGSLPETGTGIDRVIADMGRYLIPNGSQIPKPGCTAYITTGATTVGALATLCAAVAAPQRLGITAFSYLEDLSLRWLAEMFELPGKMQGIYSSGGSVANLIGLGAARQRAFERVGIDPAADGVRGKCRIYASSACHRSIHRAAAVLGLGRNSVIGIPLDSAGQLQTQVLRRQIKADATQGILAVAIVANAGCTCTGAIDPLGKIGDIAAEFGIWFHIDGAYGLPGMLDPEIRHLYDGLSLADSVTVDPHKWLGAPVGIGATFVRDIELLRRAFRQGAAEYLEGSVKNGNAEHSMDSLGIPYYDYGVELSAPCRGAVVWALIQEIGKRGLTARVCRHNAMAKQVAKRAREHPNLELVLEPTLSICCFRFISTGCDELNELNRCIVRQMARRGVNMPSTTSIDGILVIRPCFIGARTQWQQADDLIDDVISTGKQLLDDEKNHFSSEIHPPGQSEARLHRYQHLHRVGSE